jgi:hypothetical protein
MDGHGCGSAGGMLSDGRLDFITAMPRSRQRRPKPRRPRAKPQIGFAKASLYLHDALLPAYSRFQRAQKVAIALDVAQHAWALHERLWHDQGCKPKLQKFRAELFKRCPELQLMQDLAEAGKHVELSRKGVQLVSITGAENPGGVWQISDPFGQRNVAGQCTLAFNVIGGGSYKVTDVLERIVEFWVNKLK